VDLQGNSLRIWRYAGKYVKNEYYNDGEAPERSVDVEIAIRLKEENKAFKVEKYVHSYHIVGGQAYFIYYPLDSWFIKSRKLETECLN
jgi:isoleucyl-tRNA synthetase